MFKDEWLVRVDALDAKNPDQTISVQLFADARDVRGLRDEPRRKMPVAGWLMVSLAGQGRGFAEIVLPQPSQPLGETVMVREDAVRTEPGS